MTLRETLLAVRAIVAEASPEPNQCGCLEDAICRVTWGKAWSLEFAHQLGLAWINVREEDELKTLPAMRALKREARLFHEQRLFPWNDAHTKDERLALIDAAIEQL